MTRFCITSVALFLGTAACSSGLEGTAATRQSIWQQQGTALQGILLQGTQTQGMTFQDFRSLGATLGGAALSNLRVENGELKAEQNGVTLGNTALVNAHLFADFQTKNPSQGAVVEYRITGIAPEQAEYDRAPTGMTFLYTLEQNVDGTGNWQPACAVDGDGLRAAIPLSDVWDDKGGRSSPAQEFTLGCTTGAVAKCYRWGYRPWDTSIPGANLKITHWTCTRLARADYCGDGVSHTMDGTMIDVFDTIPIQSEGTPPAGYTFEAAWDQNGALCFSHARWNLGGAVLAAACPNRLMPPKNNQGGTVCDNVQQSGGGARMFDDSTLGN